MDHLPSPSSPNSRYPRVPYICEETDDCLDFLAFGESYAKKWGVSVASTQTGPTLWLSRAQSKFGVATVEGFLQRWIFFGLLHETFAPLGLFDPTHYLEKEGASAYVHTKTLRDTAQTWSAMVAQWDDLQKTTLGGRLYECVTVVNTSISSLFWDPGRTDINHNVILSLFVMIETIAGLADAALLLSDDRNYPFPGSQNPSILTDPMMAQMLECGWCRSEVAAIQLKFCSVTTRLFLQQMQRFKFDHNDCQEHMCRRLQLQSLDDEGQVTTICDSSYNPLHVDSVCKCDFLGPDRAKVKECLERRTFPLLKVNHDSARDPFLDVEPFREGAPFVAISHLWIDGLGNPDSTELPTCQAHRIQSLLDSLHGKTFQFGLEPERRTEDRKLRLWCDTYCCPTEKEDFAAHRLALSRLREVYEKATYVLVIDQELGRINHADLGPIERVARLVTSRWMKRLWTFQESALATKLLINFADGVVDLRDLTDDIKSYYEQNPTDRLIAREIFYPCYSMKVWLNAATDENSQKGKVFRLMHAVHGRGISKATDEPLCLTAVLGLDLGTVVGTNPEQRMEAFWALAACSESGVPTGIIFNSYPRLSVKGYNWAPASLIGRSLSHPGRHGLRATWTPYGLRIKLPGWRIRLEQSFLQYSLATEPNDGAIAALRTTGGDWYHISRPKGIHGDAGNTILHLLRDDTKHWYLVLEGDNSQPSGQMREGLITYIELRPDGQVVFRSVATVSVHRVREVRQMSRRVASEYAIVIKQHPITQKLRRWSYCEHLVGRVIHLTPTIFHQTLRIASRWFLRIVFGNVRSRFNALLDDKAREASDSPEGVEVGSRLFDARTPPPWRSNILKSLTERHATIMEYFDSDHEWCID